MEFFNRVSGALSRSACSTATTPGGWGSAPIGLATVQLLYPYVNGVLTDDGQSVRVFHDPCRAVAEFGNEPYSLVITDIKIPGMDGIEVLDQIKRINPHVPVIIITAHATVDVSIQALRRELTISSRSRSSPRSSSTASGRH